MVTLLNACVPSSKATGCSPAFRPGDIRNEKGHDMGVIVASSGFRQDTDDGWLEMGNDTMLVASRQTGRYFLRSLLIADGSIEGA